MIVNYDRHNIFIVQATCFDKIVGWMTLRQNELILIC